MGRKVLWTILGILPTYGDALEDLITATIELNELPSGLHSNGNWNNPDKGSTKSKEKINLKKSDLGDLLESRQVPEGSELDAHEKHVALLEKVIRFGLNQSQYLIDVQVFMIILLLLFSRVL